MLEQTLHQLVATDVFWALPDRFNCPPPLSLPLPLTLPLPLSAAAGGSSICVPVLDTSESLSLSISLWGSYWGSESEPECSNSALVTCLSSDIALFKALLPIYKSSHDSVRTHQSYGHSIYPKLH